MRLADAKHIANRTGLGSSWAASPDSLATRQQAAAGLNNVLVLARFSRSDTAWLALDTCASDMLVRRITWPGPRQRQIMGATEN